MTPLPTLPPLPKLPSLPFDESTSTIDEPISIPMPSLPSLPPLPSIQSLPSGESIQLTLKKDYSSSTSINTSSEKSTTMFTKTYVSEELNEELVETFKNFDATQQNFVLAYWLADFYWISPKWNLEIKLSLGSGSGAFANIGNILASMGRKTFEEDGYSVERMSLGGSFNQTYSHSSSHSWSTR